MNLRSKIVILIFLFVASCFHNVKRGLRAYNYAFAVSVVETYRVFYDFIASEEGTYIICKKLIDEHKKQGIYDENLLQRQCEQRIAEVEKSFDNKLTIVASALEMFENSIDVWDKIEDKRKREIVGAVITAVDSLIEFLESLQIKIPDKLIDVLNYMNNLSGALK